MISFKNSTFISIKEFLKIKDFSNYSFGIGMILLLSAPTIAGFFLLISIFISSIKSKQNYFKDKSNYIFIISSISLLLITLVNNFTGLKPDLEGYENYLSWVGLFNWIPYFYCLWAFKPYLNSSQKRRKAALFLIIGSMPLFFTGIGQYWFNWNGPFKGLNGLIIWFQRDLHFSDGLTGLFNNANYAGSWFVIILPFLFALFLDKRNSKLNKFIAIFFATLAIVLIYFTKSRNGLLSAMASIQIFSGSRILLFIFLSLILLLFLILLLNTFLILPQIGDLIRKVIQSFFFGNFYNLSLDLSNFPRIMMFSSGVKLFLERPFLGWGAASFPILYRPISNIWYGHSHNIILELLVSYGIICTAIIIFGITKILIKSFKIIYLIKNKGEDNILKNDKFIDRAWWTSTSTLLLSQMFDIQFLDFRISMIFWILLSGLSTMQMNTNKID